MTLDTTQILILVVIAIVILDAIKDLVRDIHVWRLIETLAGKGQGAPTFPVPPGPPPIPIPIPDPGPLGPPDKPPVVPDKPPITPPITPPVPPVPVPGVPRFTNITATSFAGVSDSAVSKESAYYPAHYPTKVIDSNKPGAALPYHFPGTPPTLRIFGRKGKTIDIPTVDVGPWNTNDAYWDHSSRPQAESGTDTRGRHTNRAGIDLTPGAWAALGYTGNLDAITDTVSWDFVSVLDKGATPVPLPPVGPTQPPVGGTVLQHNVWPTQAECPSFYGASEAAIRAQLVTVHVPWLMNGKTQTIEVHRKCADSLTRIVNYIWEYCGKSQDKIHEFGYDIFDGSFNWRYIAGTQTPSVHSYGAAVDFDAAANPIRNPGKFKPESLIVHAFTQEDWIWLGPTFDPMHFQAARVR